jgi:hypothetical protein
LCISRGLARLVPCGCREPEVEAGGSRGGAEETAGGSRGGGEEASARGDIDALETAVGALETAVVLLRGGAGRDGGAFRDLAEQAGRGGGAGDSRGGFRDVAEQVDKQRYQRKKGKLEEGRVRRLEELGFVWGTQEEWEARYGELVAYKERFGDSRVPHGWEENPQLGRWVDKQRQQRKKGKVEAGRLQRLEELGFVWDLFGAAFRDWAEQEVRGGGAGGGGGAFRDVAAQAVRSGGAGDGGKGAGGTGIAA